MAEPVAAGPAERRAAGQSRRRAGEKSSPIHVGSLGEKLALFVVVGSPGFFLRTTVSADGGGATLTKLLGGVQLLRCDQT